MEKDISKSMCKIYMSKIARLKLSTAQKHDLKIIMPKAIVFVPDIRFRRPTVMSPIMRQSVDSSPGAILSQQQEHTLFLQLNYCRYKMNICRRKILKKAKWRNNEILELLHWYQKQLQARAQIASANMGLVPAMAKHVNYSGVEFTELVSEGNMALLRTIDHFDCSRGCKFSTYACQAILKSFSRIAKQSYRYRKFFPVQFDPAYEKDNYLDRLREEFLQDQVLEVCTIIRENLANLSGIEMSVMKNRFPLSQEAEESLTLKQLGQRLDLSKERVRQIQNQALAKLRDVAEERMIAI